MAFIVLSVSQLFYSLSMRNFNKSILRVGLFSNKLLIGAIVIGIALQMVVIYVPFLASAFGVQSISIADVILVIGFCLIPLFVNEIIKALTKQKG